MARILVVDDEKEMRETLVSLLQEEGFEAVEAFDGNSCLEIVKKIHIDLILLDIRMPVKDGIDVLAEIKKIKDIPVIMVTGYGTTKAAVESMKLGAFDFIEKPFNNFELINMIKKALATYKPEEVKKYHLTPTVYKKVIPYKLLLPLLGVFVICLLLFFFFIKKEEEIKAYPVSFSHPSSIAYDGKYFWISDWINQQIYQYKLEKEFILVKTYNLPGKHITGIAIGKNVLFTCDPEQKKIYRHKFDDVLSVISSSSSPGPQPSGLFFDGKYLWSCDALEHKIYKHMDDKDLTVVDQFPSPGTHPTGIYINKKYIYSVDAMTKKIYKHEMDKLLSIKEQYVLPPGIEDISVFTFVNDSIFISAENLSKIYRFKVSKLIPVP
jgi:CheY-like chemotaxis protein